MRPFARFATAAALLALLAGPAAAQQAPTDSADVAWNAGDHARARALYAARVARDSSDVQAVHRLGLLYGWNREYDRAIPLLERLVRLAPSARTRMDLANVLAWSRSYDRALAMVDQALAADPGWAEAVKARASFLSWAGRYGEAAAAYEAIIAQDPGDVEAVRGLARVTTWRQDLAGGERLWRQALEREPDNADTHIGLSQVLRWRGRAGEALEHAERAAALRPNDRETLEQLAWAEAAFRPRIAPTFSAELDSDENHLYTAAVNATVPMTRRLSGVLNASLRQADGPVPLGGEGRPSTWSALAGLRADVIGGWTLAGAAGVTDRTEGDPETVYRGSLSAPAWGRLTGTASFAHSVFDATADLMGRGVTLDDASLSGTFEIARPVRLEGGASVTRFQGVTENERRLARLGLEFRPSGSWRIRPRATAFEFDRTLAEGYFSPDEYRLGEVGIGYDRYLSGWSLSAEAAPGAQKIGSSGDWKRAVSARFRAGYTVAPGREVAIGFSYSDLGIERVAATGDGAYRYQAVVVSGSWGF